ncbi:hypothetical protein [Novipirellula artificiosorum]|uniref:Uncharacterized protein n=1 Tax=Novipirellula artificiosorum TaxID=2528016 RepID=A0A5C6DAU0_9BACT|nr:hypothetical protein [Novipirellula artificiosorum]TWU33818.1 hypothetical protein Poly41_48170 [Novipirellula artificiosorum]
MRKAMLPENRFRFTTAVLVWIPIIIVLSGCGPSGRDLSDLQWLEIQQALQDERAEVGKQRDLLEADRREFDERERSEPVLAAVISASALLICCSLPLLLVAVLLWPRKREQESQAVCEAMLDEVVTVRNLTSGDTKRISASPTPKRLATGGE